MKPRFQKILKALERAGVLPETLDAIGDTLGAYGEVLKELSLEMDMAGLPRVRLERRHPVPSGDTPDAAEAPPPPSTGGGRGKTLHTHCDPEPPPGTKENA